MKKPCLLNAKGCIKLLKHSILVEPRGGTIHPQLGEWIGRKVPPVRLKSQHHCLVSK